MFALFFHFLNASWTPRFDMWFPGVLSSNSHSLLMRSILTGGVYPESLYTTVLSRIRADNKIGSVRASVIKACLSRKARINNQIDKGEVLTMGLNENSSNTPYRLGRLFALLVDFMCSTFYDIRTFMHRL